MEDWASFFYYDETSPSCLRWKVDILSGRGKGRSHVKAGDKAGALSLIHGYANVQVGGKKYRVHRVIWEMLVGKLEKGQILDHKDGNPSNNKLCNLRVVDRALNSRNTKMGTLNRSGKVGVFRREILVKGKRYPTWIAKWYTETNKEKSLAFSVTKYGEEAARSMAEKARDYAIEDMNKGGAGYTERHGT